MVPMLHVIRRNGIMHSWGVALSLSHMQVAEPEVEPVEAKPFQEQAEPATLDLTRLFAQYKVILHNDDELWAHYVVRSLLKVVSSLTVQEAWRITIRAHMTGKAVVIVCHKEAAEFYQERLQSCGLAITIEPE